MELLPDTKRDVILRGLYTHWVPILLSFGCSVITIFVIIIKFFSFSIAIHATASLIEFTAYLLYSPLCKEEYGGGFACAFDGNWNDRNNKWIPFAKKISGCLICIGFLLWIVVAFI